MWHRVDRRLSAALGITLALTACGVGRAGKDSGVSSASHHVQVGGLKREYRLDLPSGEGPGRHLRLIVALHAGGSTPDQFARVTRLGSRGPAAGFAVAYPKGVGGTWNAGDCCGVALSRGIDDLGFIRAMLDDIGHRNPEIDVARVYAMGFSNGGKLAYQLACQTAERFIAIAPAGTGLARVSCAPVRPVSVLHFHGTADRFHPYNGGHGAGPTTHDVHQRSAPSTVATWARLDGCPTQSRTTYLRGQARCRERSPCREERAVVLCTIAGMGHQWPGTPPVLPHILGPGSNDLDATCMSLRFFARPGNEQ